MIKKKITWDTTVSPCDYPEEIKNFFFSLSISNRKNYVSWIDSISKNNLKNLDWWLSPPASRNPTISNLHKNITILETLDKLKKIYRYVNIKTNSKNLSYLINNWIIRENLGFKVILMKNQIKFQKLYYIKTFLFHLIIFIYLNFFVKKKNILNDKSKCILIDIFQTDEKIGKKFQSLINYKKKEREGKFFFIPTFVIERNIFKVIKVINKIAKKNYLFKEHFISLKDFFNCFARRNFEKKFYDYKKWDLSLLLKEELEDLTIYPSIFMGRLNYKFFKKIKLKKINFVKTINWFENQPVDKGWNLGARSFFPNKKNVGYQGFTHYAQFMNNIPTLIEDKAKVIPKEVLTIGKAYVKMKKEFFSKLKVSVAPALDYQKIFYSSKIKNKIDILIVLNGIYDLDKKMIEWSIDFLKKNKLLTLKIKDHPILPFNNFLIKEKNIKSRLKIYNDDLDNLLKKSINVITSGPTSASFQSLAYGCNLIVPVFEPCDEKNIKDLNISSKLYKLIYNKQEFTQTIYDILKNKKKKNNPSKIRNYLFEKINKKNIKLFL